jgi:hypothetical protein
MSETNVEGPPELSEAVVNATSSALGMARMLQWLGTAGRDRFNVSSVGDDLIQNRAEGVVELAIVISKQLRTKLGDDASVGYPSSEFLRVLEHLAQKYRCLEILDWAADRARS